MQLIERWKKNKIEYQLEYLKNWLEKLKKKTSLLNSIKNLISYLRN